MSLPKRSLLRIELFTQPGNKLTVRNNLLEKDGKVESTGLGLQNTNARCRMLRIPEAVIEKKDDSFSVLISPIEAKIGKRHLKKYTVGTAVCSSLQKFTP